MGNQHNKKLSKHKLNKENLNKQNLNKQGNDDSNNVFAIAKELLADIKGLLL